MAMDAARFARIFEGVTLVANDRDTLGDRLVALVTRARAAWPSFSVDDHDFVAHLARHTPPDDEASAFLATVLVEDLYLAYAVSRHDKVALEAFERAFVSRVPEYVLRTTVERDLVEEIQQTLRERLVLGTGGPPKILEYAGRGALGGWVRITAVRTALNHLRKPTTSELHEEEAHAPSLDPELSFVKAHVRDLFRAAFAHVLAQRSAEDRSMLRLHHVQGMTLDQLSRMYRVPRATLGRKIDRVRKEILAATEEHLREGHRLSPSEVISVIRSANSQIHLTLTKILQ